MRHGTHDNPVKPKGYKKAKSRSRADRRPMYLPATTTAKKEHSLWLSAR